MIDYFTIDYLLFEDKNRVPAEIFFRYYGIFAALLRKNISVITQFPVPSLRPRKGREPIPPSFRPQGEIPQWLWTHYVGDFPLRSK